MKKVLCVFLMIPFVGLSQNNLLWKVTSKDNKRTSYLFGSMHTNDSLLNTFDKTWWKAFNSCDVFAGEVNANDPTQMMEALTAAMMKDTILADLYTEEELKRVNNFILSKVDMATAMVLTKMKPFYIMAAIMEIPESKGPYDEIMDLRLQKIAVQNEKRVIGLETNKEQAESVGTMSLSEQAKMLLEFVDEGPKQDLEKEKLESFYRSQNLEDMHHFAMAYESEGTPPQLMEALIDMRNNRFAERLLPHIKDSSVFCAVGALHLPGETGLINQLRKSGYTVEPVDFKFGE